MKITISVGGPFPGPFRWAEFVEQHAELERVITFMPHSRLKSRLGLSLDPKHLVTLPWLGYLNYIQWRVLDHPPALQYWICEKFDKLAARRLGACDLFNGWSTTSLHSMRMAKSRGAATILNTGSAHIAFGSKLMDEEYEKYGVKGVVSDRRLIEKGTQEFIEADHVIVASTFVRRTLVGQGIPPEKISIVPDAVTRRLHGGVKRDDVFRIITVGRLELRKGVQYLLEAVRQLRLPHSELVLVGGPQREFEGILKRYEGCYRLAGFVSDEELGQLLSQSSVLVLPSVEDGWSHVTLEAMSCGLPVIVSDNAGSADAIKEGINGFVVPACNPEAIMAKLELLYLNPELRLEMSRQAKLSVHDRTWETYGESNRAVFEAVFQSGRR